MIRGLTDEEQKLHAEMRAQIQAKYERNKLKLDYYDMKQRLDYVGFSIPDELKDIEAVVGWAAKAVNVPASRIRRTGFTGPQRLGVLSDLEEIETATDFAYKEKLAQHAAGQTSCSFTFFTPGDTAKSEPEVITSVRDSTTATALMDPRTHRVTAALEVVSRTAHLMYLPGITLLLERRQNMWVVADDYATGTNRVRCTPYMWLPELRKPFGSARINRAVMRHIDRAIRTILRQEVTADHYSAPRGVLEDAHSGAFFDKDGKRIDPMRAIGAIWGIPAYRDQETGDLRVPSFKQVNQASFQPHSELIRTIAMNFHAETDIPLGQLGVVQDNPSSADAIRAAEDGLIALCGDQAENFSRSAKDAAMNLLSFNASDAELVSISKDMAKVRPKYANPATPTPGAQADAGMKFVSAFPQLAKTDIALERFGLDPDEVQRALEYIQAQDGQSALQLALERASTQPQGSAGKVLNPFEEQKLKAETLAQLRAAGVTPESAAKIVGLAGVEFETQ